MSPLQKSKCNSRKGGRNNVPADFRLRHNNYSHLPSCQDSHGKHSRHNGSGYRNSSHRSQGRRCTRRSPVGSSGLSSNEKDSWRRGRGAHSGSGIKWRSPVGSSGLSSNEKDSWRRGRGTHSDSGLCCNCYCTNSSASYRGRKSDPKNGPYLGIVTSVSEAGYAFIESPICKTWYGQDVYVFPRVMQENGLQEGNAVGFYVHENEKGQPAVNAFKPIWKLQMKPKQGVVPPLGRYAGGVLNLTSMGHAYVCCPEVKYQYSKDVYVNEKVVKANDLQEGQYICFDVHINSSGMPQASSPLWLETNKREWVRPIPSGKRYGRDESSRSDSERKRPRND